MFLAKRRGIIGFMITLALGVAVGAATLVVGNEVVKNMKNSDEKKEKSGFQNPRYQIQNTSLEMAAKRLARAQRDYYKSVTMQAGDLNEKSQALKQAKAEYERILKQMNSPATAPEVSGSGQRNPFDDSGPVTPPLKSVVPAEKQNTQAVNFSPSISERNLRLEYYRVKPGDTLWDICRRYYGDGGMWQHILKYQIPSIAACPNLIFPGQLIALPRNITVGTNENSDSSVTESPGNSGNLSPLPPASQGDESWQTKFQKNYLISDYTFTNTNTMTVSQIQSFLEAKGSVLAKPYRGGQPAQMIYNAAKKYGINPQVLLTRLQCEQGLISKKSATQKELDWALGVGCYDSGNWNQNFKGFDKQIEGAAATYRRHYLDAKAKLDRGETITMTIDGQTVHVKNAATYSFYKYCPHFHGNKLFFDVWNGFAKHW